MPPTLNRVVASRAFQYSHSSAGIYFPVASAAGRSLVFFFLAGIAMAQESSSAQRSCSATRQS